MNTLFLFMDNKSLCLNCVYKNGCVLLKNQITQLVICKKCKKYLSINSKYELTKKQILKINTDTNFLESDFENVYFKFYAAAIIRHMQKQGNLCQFYGEDIIQFFDYRAQAYKTQFDKVMKEDPVKVYVSMEELGYLSSDKDNVSLMEITNKFIDKIYQFIEIKEKDL